MNLSFSCYSWRLALETNKAQRKTQGKETIKTVKKSINGCLGELVT